MQLISVFLFVINLIYLARLSLCVSIQNRYDKEPIQPAVEESESPQQADDDAAIFLDRSGPKEDVDETVVDGDENKIDEDINNKPTEIQYKRIFLLEPSENKLPANYMDLVDNIRSDTAQINKLMTVADQELHTTEDDKEKKELMKKELETVDKEITDEKTMANKLETETKQVEKIAEDNSNNGNSSFKPHIHFLNVLAVFMLFYRN